MSIRTNVFKSKYAVTDNGNVYSKTSAGSKIGATIGAVTGGVVNASYYLHNQVSYSELIESMTALRESKLFEIKREQLNESNKYKKIFNKKVQYPFVKFIRKVSIKQGAPIAAISVLTLVAAGFVVPSMMVGKALGQIFDCVVNNKRAKAADRNANK